MLSPNPHKSRIHPLPSFGEGIFVKREDELGGLLGGSKLRKYASLIPALRAGGYRDVVVLGGARANNPAFAAQLLVEAGFGVHLVLRGEPDAVPAVNQLVMRLCVPRDRIVWLPRRTSDSDAAARAAALCRELEGGGRAAFVLPEGAACEAAFAGAMSAAEDIVRNEVEAGVRFERIFLDAGTGVAAACTIVGMAALGRRPQFEVVVVAGTEKGFMTQLARVKAWAEVKHARTVALPPEVRVVRPRAAASFGATSAELFAFIARLAQNDGVLTDPLYTGKLFREAERCLAENPTPRPSLIVHSGGLASLSGFAAPLTAARL